MVAIRKVGGKRENNYTYVSLKEPSSKQIQFLDTIYLVWNEVYIMCMYLSLILECLYNFFVSAYKKGSLPLNGHPTSKTSSTLIHIYKETSTCTYLVQK